MWGAGLRGAGTCIKSTHMMGHVWHCYEVLWSAVGDVLQLIMQ